MNTAFYIWLFSVYIIFSSVIIGCKTNDIGVENVATKKNYTLEATELLNLTELQLKWTNPTQNMDGTPLTDFAGAKMYYGRYSSNYHRVIDVGDVNSTWLTNLTSSDRYFNGTAYNELGVESDYAHEIRWYSCIVEYTNKEPIVIELENVILDIPMSITNDNYETYIYNPSNSEGYANFTFVYSLSNQVPPINQFAMWIKTKSNSTNSNFDISYRGHSFSTNVDEDTIHYSNYWSFTTLSSTKWKWQALKVNDSPFILNVSSNIRDTFSIALANTNTMLDKFLFTTNLNYNPNPPEILPVIDYILYDGTEFILDTNSVLLSWKAVSNATTYKVYGKWHDTTQGRLYHYGSTSTTNIYVPMSRAGHFYYYIDSYEGTNKLLRTRSDISNSTFFVHGYTNNLPWKIYWKLPKPGGIIVE